MWVDTVMIRTASSMVLALMHLTTLLPTASSNPTHQHHQRHHPRGSGSNRDSNVNDAAIRRDNDRDGDVTATWPLLPHVLQSMASSNAYEDGRPCAREIPDSAYVDPQDQIPRQTRHQGGDSCPFEFVDTTDENRIPAIMPEAKCKCRSCQLPHHLRRRSFQCLPIYHMVPVMRRSPDLSGQNGGWVYALERLSVGCTCRKTRRCSRRRTA